MTRWIQIAVSLLMVGVICGGADYAVGRERVRGTDLQALYDQVSRDSFGNSLPPATVEWAELPDAYGKTTFYTDGSTTIMVDRASVTTEVMLWKTVRHEACHVATGIVDAGADAHGNAWQVCMSRFETTTTAPL